MSYITDESYYGDSANHGSYQFIPLSEIVDNFILTRVGKDKEIRYAKWHEVMFHAKQGIKQFNYHASKEISAIEVLLDTNLDVIMPPDYVDYVRISVNRNGELMQIHENTKAITATKYSQDSNYDFMFDVDGNVVTEQSLLDKSRLTPGQYTGAGVYHGCDGWYDHSGTWYFAYRRSGYFNANTADINSGGSFSIDKVSGIIHFSSVHSGQEIVIEYISDGMKGGVDTEISIHKLAEEYLYAYIKYCILAEKIGVPEYVKRRAQKKKTAEFNNTRVAMGDFKGSRLMKLLRGRTQRF